MADTKGRGGISLDVSMLLKVAGIGLTVAILCQILGKYGRDDQAMLVGIAGIVAVLLMLVGEIGKLIDALSEVFGL